MANQCDLYMKRKKKKDSQGLRYWNGHRPVFGTYTIVLKQIAAMKVIWPQFALLGFKCLAGLLFIDIIIHNIFKYIYIYGSVAVSGPSLSKSTIQLKPARMAGQWWKQWLPIAVAEVVVVSRFLSENNQKAPTLGDCTCSCLHLPGRILTLSPKTLVTLCIQHNGAMIENVDPDIFRFNHCCLNLQLRLLSY